MTLGYTLDDGLLSWDDLHAVIYASPPGSAVFQAVEKGWTPDTYKLAETVDLLHIVAWQNTADGHAGRNQPKPIRRPTDPEEVAPTTGSLMGGEVASVMTVGEFLRRRAEREERWRQRHQKGG